MRFPYTSEFCGIWSRCEFTVEVGRMSDVGRLESFLSDSRSERNANLPPVSPWAASDGGRSPAVAEVGGGKRGGRWRGH
eukprot:5616444-Prymnesium_polylepis.1